MRFNEDKMKNAIHSYTEFPGEDYDEDVFNVVDKYCYTSDFDELIFVYGLVCGEFVRQGMMKFEDI